MLHYICISFIVIITFNIVVSSQQCNSTHEQQKLKLSLSFESLISENKFGAAYHPTIDLFKRNPYTQQLWAIRNILDTGSYGALMLAGGYHLIDDLSHPHYPLIKETRPGLINLIKDTHLQSDLNNWKSIFDTIEHSRYPYFDEHNHEYLLHIPKFKYTGWQYYLGSTTGGFIAKSSLSHFYCTNYPDSAETKCPRYAILYSYTNKLANLLDGTGKLNHQYQVPIIPAIWGLAPGSSASSNNEKPEATSNWPFNPSTDWIWDHDSQNAHECLFFEFKLNHNVPSNNSFLIDANCGHVHLVNNPLIIIAEQSPYWMFATLIDIAYDMTIREVKHHDSQTNIFNVLIDTGFSASVLTDQDVWDSSFSYSISHTVTTLTMIMKPYILHKDSSKDLTSFSFNIKQHDISILTDSTLWYKGSDLVLGWGVLKSFNRLSFAYPYATLVDSNYNEIGHITDGSLRIIYH